MSYYLSRSTLECLHVVCFLLFIPAVARPMSEDVPWLKSSRGSGYVVYTRSALEVMDESRVPSRGDTAAKLRCELARNQYEACHIGVYAIGGDLHDVTLEVESDLLFSIRHRGQRDYRYQAWESLKTGLGPHMALVPGNTIETVHEGRSGSFWVTFYADAETTSGERAGTVQIRVAGKPGTSLPLFVHVRPFLLPRPRVAYGSYFGDAYSPWKERADDPERGDDWLRAVYTDMAEHGYTSMTSWSGWWDRVPPEDMRTLKNISLAKAAGVLREDIPVLSMGGISHTNLKTEFLSWLAAETARNIWPEVIHYAIDEPAYPDHRVPLKCLPWLEVPNRVGTAMGSRAAFGYGWLHDVWIMYGGQVILGGGTHRRRGVSPFRRAPSPTFAGLDPLPPFLGRGIYPRPATKGTNPLGIPALAGPTRQAAGHPYRPVRIPCANGGRTWYSLRTATLTGIRPPAYTIISGH